MTSAFTRYYSMHLTFLASSHVQHQMWCQAVDWDQDLQPAGNAQQGTEGTDKMTLCPGYLAGILNTTGNQSTVP